MHRKHRISIAIGVFAIALIASAFWFVDTKHTVAEETPKTPIAEVSKPYKEGKHVVVYLEKMTLELRDGDTVLSTFNLVSKGKPGNYYETIGGEYVNDYKTPLHFSSLGLVYMPYSVHVYGNYFIHGIPYHPGGEKVPNGYSGGCVRLEDKDAKVVYDFVTKGTPIIITDNDMKAFTPTEDTEQELTSQEMTNLMVATVSLEALAQDNPILNTDGKTSTTRLELLPRLLVKGDVAVSLLYSKALGEKTYISMMNQKAKALGLTNTVFTDLTSPVSTTYEDYERFMDHIDTHKSYLRKIQNSTSRSL